jgi:hypothetical protein
MGRMIPARDARRPASRAAGPRFESCRAHHSNQSLTGDPLEKSAYPEYDSGRAVGGLICRRHTGAHFSFCSLLCADGTAVRSQFRICAPRGVHSPRVFVTASRCPHRASAECKLQSNPLQPRRAHARPASGFFGEVTSRIDGRGAWASPKMRQLTFYGSAPVTRPGLGGTAP